MTPPPPRQLRQFVDTAALAAAAAEEVVLSAHSAIASHGRFVIALSGGTTPALLYERLARTPVASRIDWERVHVCWGDERCVPPDDSRSNFRMARDRLLDHLPIPAGQIHRMPGELAPEVSARAYEHALRVLLNTPRGAPRTGAFQRFDMVLLGMGADGHTASLFPGGDAVQELERWAVAAEAPHALASSGVWRVTLTLPLINAARQVLLLAAGAEKAEVLHRVLAPPPDVEALPAQRVSPTNGRLQWMVDRAAAALLG